MAAAREDDADLVLLPREDVLRDGAFLPVPRLVLPFLAVEDDFFFVDELLDEVDFFVPPRPDVFFCAICYL